MPISSLSFPEVEALHHKRQDLINCKIQPTQVPFKQISANRKDSQMGNDSQ